MSYDFGSLTCHPTHKTGAHDIWFASPWYGALLPLGVSTDGIRYQSHPYYIDVHGDRNGGHQGPPIEKQYLGEIVIISFSLTTYHRANLETVRKRGVLATNGVVPQAAVGDFLLGAAAMRLLLRTEVEADIRNFWCAIPVQAQEVTEGSKFSEWSLSFECHRAPCGAVISGASVAHPKAGILEDKNWAAYS